MPSMGDPAGLRLGVQKYNLKDFVPRNVLPTVVERWVPIEDQEICARDVQSIPLSTHGRLHFGQLAGRDHVSGPEVDFDCAILSIVQYISGLLASIHLKRYHILLDHSFPNRLF